MTAKTTASANAPVFTYDSAVPVWRRWLLAALLLTLIAAMAGLWLWHASESRSLRDMYRNTSLQLRLIEEAVAELPEPNAQPAVTGTLDAERIAEQLDKLWTAHWENAHGRFAGWHPRLELEQLYRQPATLEARMRRLTSTQPEPSLSKADFATITADLHLVAERIQNTQQALGSTRMVQALWLLAGLAAALALCWGLWLRPLARVTRRGAASLAASQKRLSSLERTDLLTNAGNRKAVTAFLSEVRAASYNDGEFLALALLDIDHFSQLNDVLGYFAGDHVLQEVATRIQRELRDGDKLGRLDGDKFAIVLQHLASPKDAEQIIARIQGALMREYVYREQPISITTTVGVNVQEMRSLDLAELFKMSDKALLRAKQDHRSSALLLSHEATRAISRQREISSRLQRQQPSELFDIVYQPIVALADQRIVSCESLLRWRDSEPADLHPDEFVPILEMFGQIGRTGEWILKQCLSDLARWRATAGQSDLAISINVSARQLESDDYIDLVISETDRLGLPASSVTLELTEGSLIKQKELGRHQLALLRNRGFGISLDDFGTGYSSLQYLKKMPASAVKIDRSFVTDMLHDEREEVIVESAIRIARAIGLAVIAEGVETPQQADRLTSLGCDYAQGYWFAAPLTAGEFEQFLQRQTIHHDPSDAA